MIGKGSGYHEGVDMPTAPHSRTIMAFSLPDENLPAKNGYSLKTRTPTKPGFKNGKFVTVTYVANGEPRGYWTDRGYNWLSGI